MRSVLHIFNGDCAADAWKKAVHSSERYLVWRENYLEGPIPAADTPREEFAKVRAEYLHTCAPEYSVDMLTRFQCELEAALQTLDSTDVVMLWFDECMFDMLLLSRILLLLEKSPAELHLCCENRVLGNETDFFRTPWQNFRQLKPETVCLYADAWRAFAGGNAVLANFLKSGRPKEEPALDRALHRYLADHPLDHSLGLSEHKFLKLIAYGTNEFMQIFRAFNASEERPFMGDTMCERLLQDLVSRGFLIREINTEKRVFYYATELAKFCTCDYHKQGIACADAQKAIAGMKQLREAAKDCRRRADYVAFMRKLMPIDIEEADDGIILYLHKKGCTCVHPEFITKCESNLCECTKAHEEYTWSAFFGKPVKVEIVESFLRSGKDCVIKLLI